MPHEHSTPHTHSPESADPSGTELVSRKKRKIVIVDTSENVEDQARDMADEQMAAEKGSLTGIKGFAKRVWKHNLFKEYYRQKEIRLARDRIIQSGSLYAGENAVDGDEAAAALADQRAHEHAMAMVMDRFSSEYSEAIHTDAGEARLTLGKRFKEDRGEHRVKKNKDHKKHSKEDYSKELSDDEKLENRELAKDIRDLINKYAAGSIDDANFEEEKKRLIVSITDLTQSDVEHGVKYADNLFIIAKEMRQAMEHGHGLQQLDEETEIVIGRAKLGVRTEAKYNTVDKIVAKMKSIPLVGGLLNETLMSSAVAACYSLTVGAAQRVGRSKAAAWGTFGASALVGAGIAGLNEHQRLKDDRRQHAREAAKGMTFDKNDAEMARRQEMDKVIYETVPATTLITDLNERMNNINDRASYLAAIGSLAKIEARIEESDRKQIDLIAYTDFSAVERERFNLDIARAQAKVTLQRLSREPVYKDVGNPRDFDWVLGQAKVDIKNGIYGGAEGVDQRDRLFNKMKRKKVAWAMTKGMMTGLAVGAVAQEAMAFANDNQEGMIEHLTGASEGDGVEGEKSATLLEKMRSGGMSAIQQLRGYVHGIHSPRLSENFILDNDARVALPYGVTMEPNPLSHDTYIFTKDGEVISDHIAFKDGQLTPGSAAYLREHGVMMDVEDTHFTKQHYETITETHGAHEMVEQNPDEFRQIHRDFWYDNNTEKIDKNELKLHWGGKHGTGIDGHGNYVFNIGKMTSAGSVFRDMKIDVHQAVAEGKMKMLLSLSRDTQFNAVEVPIDAHGNAVIDPNSKVGKMFFKNEGGQLRFMGRFAEVGYEHHMGNDGVPHFRVLATDEGPGLQTVTETREELIEEPYTEHFTRFSVVEKSPESLPVDLPPVVPLIARNPLERMKKNKGVIPKAPAFVTSPYYYGAYGSENKGGLFEEMKHANGMHDPYIAKEINGKTVWVDKEGNPVRRDVARERSRIINFLNKKDRVYKTKIEALASKFEPMNNKCRLSIQVPARFEAANLNTFLDQYLNLEDDKGNPIDRDLFEVNILVNRKEGEPADDSMRIISEWKARNPGYHVNAVDVVFKAEDANVGNARDYLASCTLARSVRRDNPTGPLYIESEDADVVSIDRRTVTKLINDFDRNPGIDILRGVQDRQPEIMRQNALLLFGQRLKDIMEVFLRREAYRPENMQGSSFVWNRVISGGWNTAFTAEAYVQIGGYVPDVIGEDMKIGQKVSLLRGTVEADGSITPNTSTAATSGLRSSSSPRRFIDAMIKKQDPYANFEDQGLKGKTVDELLDSPGVKEFAKVLPEHKAQYEQAICSVGEFILSALKQPEAEHVLRRTLWALGLRAGDNHFEINSANNTVKLTDEGMAYIAQMLENYRTSDKATLGYRRQTSFGGKNMPPIPPASAPAPLASGSPAPGPANPAPSPSPTPAPAPVPVPPGTRPPAATSPAARRAARRPVNPAPRPSMVPGVPAQRGLGPNNRRRRPGNAVPPPLPPIPGGASGI